MHCQYWFVGHYFHYHRVYQQTRFCKHVEMCRPEFFKMIFTILDPKLLHSFASNYRGEAWRRVDQWELRTRSTDQSESSFGMCMVSRALSLWPKTPKKRAKTLSSTLFTASYMTIIDGISQRFDGEEKLRNRCCMIEIFSRISRTCLNCYLLQSATLPTHFNAEV